jgi:protein-disulfide isomerase
VKIHRFLIKFLAVILISTIGMIAHAETANNDNMAMPTATSSSNPANGLNADQVKQIVREYLLSNPQILIEMTQALQQQEQQEMVKNQAKANETISSNLKTLMGEPNAPSPTAGKTDAKVTVIEFFDYQCPHCKDMTKVVDQLMQKNPNIKVVFKELPIFGDSSKNASKIALAAAKQGKYSQFHHALMDYKAKNGRLTLDEVLEVAKSMGLDTAQLKKDMDSSEVNNQIKANYDLAQKLGIMGTPAFIVISKNVEQGNAKPVFISGETSEESLQKAIDELGK